MHKIFAGSPASREQCAAAYQAIAARWNPPREFMVELVNMNSQLLFPRGNDAPNWPEALALDVDGTRRFHTLHLCPGPHRRKGDVPCGYVYLSVEPELQSCPQCGQYRLVQSGLLVGQPRWFGIVFDFSMIWRDRFATPGYSSMLNPTHGRRLPQARPLDDKMENIWDSEIWREKVQECPVMSSERRHPAFSWSQDTVSLTVDKKGGRSLHLYVMRDESLPPDVARKHENLELLGILPNTYRTVDGELRKGKSEYIPFTKYLVAHMKKAWSTGIDVLDADSQPPMTALRARPKSIFDVHDYPGGCEIHGQLGSGATQGCIKCHIAGHYLGPGHMGYLDHRRYLPDDHPFRRDPRFGAEEVRLPPAARTHATMTRDGATAARLQKAWRHGVYGAQAALGKHASDWDEERISYGVDAWARRHQGPSAGPRRGAWRAVGLPDRWSRRRQRGGRINTGCACPARRASRKAPGVGCR